MDDIVREIIEISKDSKYIIVAPGWFSSADGEQLREALEDFMSSDRVFAVLSDGFVLRKVG